MTSLSGPRLRTKPVVAPELRGQWWRFGAVLAITAFVLLPVLAILSLAFRPSRATGDTSGFTFDNFIFVFTQTLTPVWLANSTFVALATVVIAVVISAPAGYVLSRGRGRLVGGYSLLLFVIQALPVIVLVVPLFMLFAPLLLVDNLLGIVLIYVGSTLPVTVWMMASYFDTIPIELEEAAWIDGSSVFGGFIRMVLRNALPGILSAAIFAFLQAWNDYLIALVFLRSEPTLTLQVGLQSFFQQNATDWGPVMAIAVIMLLPPVIVFSVLNRYFSVGGVGGSLAGR